MPFLEINGITVPVVEASARRTIVKRGEKTRSARGILRDGTRGIRRQWEVELCFTDKEEARAFENLIDGLGHFVDMDQPVASTGLTPFGEVRMRFNGATWGSAGRGVGIVDATISDSGQFDGFIRYDAQLNDRWTILWREKTTSDSDSLLGWNFHAIRDDQACYQNGSPGNNSLTRITVADGVAYFRNEFDNDYAIEDILILPWRVPNAWLEKLTNPNCPKWPAMPMLTARGDFIEQDYAHVYGEILGSQIVSRKRVGSLGWVNDGIIVRARLSEVDQTYASSRNREEETPIAGIALPAHWFTTSDIDGRANASLTIGSPIVGWRNRGSIGGTADPGISPTYLKSYVANYNTDLLEFRPSYIAAAGTTAWRLALCVFRNRTAGATEQPLFADLLNPPRVAVWSSTSTFDKGLVVRTPGETFALGNQYQPYDWNTAIISFDGSSSFVILNGVRTNTSLAAAPAVDGVFIGARQGLATSENDIAEIAIWSNPPGSNGTPTIDELESYLSKRYGARI